MKKIFIAMMFGLLFCLQVLGDDYDSPEWIKDVQEALNEAGYDCGTPDGIAGPKTYAAIDEI